MDKKIITIAEVGFALIFIILMASIVGNVIGFGNASNDKLEHIRETVNNAELESYNGSIVSGDTVISTINKMTESDTGVKMSYAVCYNQSNPSLTDTGTESHWNFYGCKKIEFSSGAQELVDSNNNSNNPNIENLKSGDGGEYTKYKIATKPGETGYISPVQEFTSTLAFNSNGVLIGIVFTANS